MVMVMIVVVIMVEWMVMRTDRYMVTFTNCGLRLRCQMKESAPPPTLEQLAESRKKVLLSECQQRISLMLSCPLGSAHLSRCCQWLTALPFFPCHTAQMLELLVRTLRLPTVTLVDSEAGCAKLHGMLQYPVLTRSLAYTIVDMFLARAFPQAGLKVFGLPHHGDGGPGGGSSESRS